MYHIVDTGKQIIWFKNLKNSSLLIKFRRKKSENLIDVFLNLLR